MDVIFLRHGQSERNRAHNLHMNHGDASLFTPELLATPDAKAPLSDEGVIQATKASDWFRQEYPQGFTTILCSTFTRARQTLELTKLTAQEMIYDERLVEQSRGMFDHVHPDEHAQALAEYRVLYTRDIDSRPPDGESPREHAERLRPALEHLLSNLNKDSRILVVSHGGTMRHARMHIEGIPAEEYPQTFGGDLVHHNCQAICYTSTDPASGQDHEKLAWSRSVCAYDPQRSGYGWSQF